MPTTKVPSLDLQFGISSETDTADTDRSETNVSTASPLRLPPPTPKRSADSEYDTEKSEQAKVIRLSNAATVKTPNQQRKMQNLKRYAKVGSKQRSLKAKTSTLQSQIPRPLASLKTPSTSSASTPSTPSSVSAVVTAESGSESGSLSNYPTKTATPALTLLRCPTAAILKYRARKSISQMDIKHARRTGNFGEPEPPVSHGTSDASKKQLIPRAITSPFNLETSTSHMSIIDSLLNRHFFNTAERESRCAGIRIFASIMLNAWRKRRDDVKRLTQEVDDLKRGSIKTKNQLHVFNTLFRVEQRRNDELTCQLKRSTEEITSAKSSCESLTTSLISLKADKALVEQELSVKEHEFENLNEMLTQTKSELFKAMSQQRELQTNLSIEQRKVQTLENQKNDLINEICELNNLAAQKEQSIQDSLQSKESELNKALEVVHKYESMLTELSSTNNQLRELMERDEKLKLELQFLQLEAETLRKCMDSTLSNRLKICWQHTTAYHRATINVFHYLLFCVLPAVPPPKMTTFPFTLSMEKALGIIKR